MRAESATRLTRDPGWWAPVDWNLGDPEPAQPGHHQHLDVEAEAGGAHAGEQVVRHRAAEEFEAALRVGGYSRVVRVE